MISGDHIHTQSKSKSFQKARALMDCEKYPEQTQTPGGNNIREAMRTEHLAPLNPPGALAHSFPHFRGTGF